MGRHELKRTTVCVDCGARRELTKSELAALKWDAWIGGARCADCIAKKEPRQPAPFKYEKPLVLVKTFVRCTGCGDEMESHLQGVDGWRPGIHWTITDETKRAYREERKPLPLCPGWDKAAPVTRTEERSLTP